MIRIIFLNLKNIPFCDYKKLYLNHRENYIKIIDEVASNGGFIMQKAKKDIKKFHRNLQVVCIPDCGLKSAELLDFKNPKA